MPSTPENTDQEPKLEDAIVPIFTLKIESISYNVWFGENASLLILKIFGIEMKAFISEGKFDSELVAKKITENLSPAALSDKIFDFSVRSQILAVLLQECEFAPKLPIDDPAKLARRVKITEISNVVRHVLEIFAAESKGKAEIASEPQPEAFPAPEPESLVDESAISDLIAEDESAIANLYSNPSQAEKTEGDVK